VLVFVDADVVLEPDAVAGAVTLLRTRHWGFTSPYPRQRAETWLERLVQPLLTWSWLTFLPLRAAERSPRPSLVAANGQLLVVDAAAYATAGGHAGVRDAVVDDVALARALRASGVQGAFADGSGVATCRMYDAPRALVDGYTKSLWAAFGGPGRAVAVVVMMALLWVVPWLLLPWTPTVWPAAVAGPASRVVAAVRTGNRPVADALAHPLSVLAFAALVAISLWRRSRGTLTWKARSVA
jgi:predicted nucleic acid-binding protein